MTEATKQELSLLNEKLARLEAKIDTLLSNENECLRNIAWAAEYCGIHTETIRFRIRKKGFPVIKPDGNKSLLYFRKKDVDRWIEENSLNTRK